MSYRCYTVDGFGVCFSDYEYEHMAQKFCDLINQTVEVKQSFNKYLRENDIYGIENVDNDLLEGFAESCYDEVGLVYILKEIIYELEGVSLNICKSYDNSIYLLYVPDYPWNLTEKEKNFTEESIMLIINKYLKKLTNEIAVITYYSVENGG